MLIHGEDLEALKSLLPIYRVGSNALCADSPFNTKQALPDYDDNLEAARGFQLMLLDIRVEDS